MARRPGSLQIRNAYAFLKQAELEGKVFTTDELRLASGWSVTTMKANLTKKLKPVLENVEDGCKAVGVKAMTEEAFCRLCSQNTALANDPQRPRLDPKVEGLVTKAREAALAAVQHYNNPTSLFRSDNYTVLMVIAYTALFHAAFERDGVDYVVYDEKSGLPKSVAGDVMLWEIRKCAKYYGEHYGQKYDQRQILAMVQNLEFILPIRNSIEHRYIPQLDTDIAGHCQAMLFNFERILVQEFTDYYSMRNSLSLAIQFSTARPSETIAALRRFQSAEYQALKTYISDFEATLPDEIRGDPAFEFRVWLIPKPANRVSSSDISIEFVPIDGLLPEQLADLQNAVVAIKTREKVVDYSEICTLWEQEVVTLLKARLGGTVYFGGEVKELNGAMIRWIVKAHNLQSPSDMYYRPKKPSSRPTYSQAFVDWVATEYNKDNGFFYKAKRQAQQLERNTAMRRYYGT